MKNRKKLISLVLCLSMIIGLVSPGLSITSSAARVYSIPGLEIETAFDPNFASEGQRRTIDFVNPDFENGSPAFPGKAISLFTPGHRAFVSEGSIKTNTAIVVDANMTVIQVINRAPKPGDKPSFTESTDVVAPEGGFVLLACDSSYANDGYKKFIAENFKVGDAVKLRLDGTSVTLKQVLALSGDDEAPKAQLTLNYTDMYTTTDASALVSGAVTNRNSGLTYQINIKLLDAENNLIGADSGNVAETEPGIVSGPSIVSGSAISGMIIDINEDGTFSQEVSLETGVNYIDVAIIENGVLLEKTTKSMIVFQKDQITLDEDKQVVMWIDQFANAKNLNTVEKIEKMVATAKNAGVTAFAFDVKGPEGYASYKKATLTNVPYLTETTNPSKSVEMEIDFLEEMIKASHAVGIKLYASYNFFTEGNLATGDSAIDIYEKNRDWAEVFQAPEDKGELKSVLDSDRKGTLIFVNPANEGVRQFQLDRVEEVLQNYDVDGVVMDRCRYDNQYADFSDITKTKFEAYLAGQGKTLENWPADAYKINADGTMTTGRLYNEWLTFRSQIIGDFAADLKTLVDEYEIIKGKDLLLSAYVGSWYEVYYQNGVNWADESFIYNERLNFPTPDLYTPEYRSTSYLDSIEFLMIGCYYDTEAEIAKYTTLGNILTNGKVPLIGSIDLTSLKTPELQRIGFQAAFDNSDGAMIFDLCYVNWYMIECAIKDRVYENPFTIATYNPAAKAPLTITDINTSRAEDTIVLYNSEYGDATGTNQWGVEVIVDTNGVVTNVVNKQQAIDWVWGDNTELNNSIIPEGGFVISAADKSGSRTLRQLLANSYSAGDKTTAAYITDYLQYNTNVYNKENEVLSFSVKAWGISDSVEVLVNGKAATLKDTVSGTYEIPVKLANGSNLFKVEVYVDGLKTVEKEITMTGVNVTPSPVDPTPTPTPNPTPDPTPTPKPEEETVTTMEIKDKNGVTIVANIKTGKDGAVESAVASLNISKGNKVTTSKDKKTSYITIEIPTEGLLSVVNKLGEISKETVLEVEVTLPEKDIIKQLNNSPKGESLQTTIVIPSKLSNHDNIQFTSILVPESVIEAAKLKNKDLIIKVQDEKGKAYKWTFDSKDLQNSKATGDINLALEVYRTEDKEDIQKLIDKDTKNKSGKVISFFNAGEFPAKAKVKLHIGNESKTKAKTVFLYRYNKKTNKLEELKQSNYKVDRKGYLTLELTNASDYVVLEQKPVDKIVNKLKTK
ncbi:MAG: family 10 glycosylhydrolase [Anaerocolumna aminovalerica]|uniref:family 10 glycosylhydrolase n=1 Tax=Anaerocolumna aminovalerica TaxID=1527 RepID=UPI0029080C82|nr:family 10 glycosylhydrolase [Anaerocolumna aminovalerica]MDU6265552.1 family 10 glycosylhydrolase [Anaerocolumna aminovalerica]